MGNRATVKIHSRIKNRKRDKEMEREKECEREEDRGIEGVENRDKIGMW